ncbi:MAG: hypothetical protein OCC45_10845 [Desulfotalea sp.]
MDLLSIIENLPDSGTVKSIVTVIVLSILFLLIVRTVFLMWLKRPRFFYSEGTENSGSDYEDALKVRHLEREVAKLRKEISSGLLKNASELIDREVSTYLANNLESMTSSKLEDTKLLESKIFEELEKRVNKRIDAYLASKNTEDFAASKRENEIIEKRKVVDNELHRTVEQERKSAGLMKSVMINLFVMVNFALITLFLLKGSQLSQSGALSLSGLYISLAGFIIYIFRASNSRTSVLLAIKEDLKKQNSVMEYIENGNKSGSLTNQDIEFIRILMTNHSEREKKADHPYEMVLKGVSGTNIQFKGGKMAIGEKTSSNK